MGQKTRALHVPGRKAHLSNSRAQDCTTVGAADRTARLEWPISMRLYGKHLVIFTGLQLCVVRTSQTAPLGSTSLLPPTVKSCSYFSAAAL